MSILNFNLPNIVFLDDDCGKDNVLAGRSVILHIPSMSIIEFIHLEDKEEVHLNDDVKTYYLHYDNKFGIKEEILAVVHKSNMDIHSSDFDELVAKPCVQWYGDYLTWEDEQ